MSVIFLPIPYLTWKWLYLKITSHCACSYVMFVNNVILILVLLTYTLLLLQIQRKYSSKLVMFDFPFPESSSIFVAWKEVYHCYYETSPFWYQMTYDQIYDFVEHFYYVFKCKAQLLNKLSISWLYKHVRIYLKLNSCLLPSKL